MLIDASRHEYEGTKDGKNDGTYLEKIEAQEKDWEDLLKDVPYKQKI